LIKNTVKNKNIVDNKLSKYKGKTIVFTGFRDKDIDKFIDISIKTQSNYDIALVLFKMYEYDFKYSDNEWYIYKNHIWNREIDGMSLRQKISTELVKKYMKLMSFYNKFISNTDITEEEKEEYKKKNVVVLEVIKKLKTTAFKENVMKECKELFCDKDFIKKIDTNPYLLGFANGVYDLKKGELRDGRPDDYLEMSTDIDKIDFAFRLFDTEGTGYLRPTEMINVLSQMNRVASYFGDPVMTEEQVNILSQTISQLVLSQTGNRLPN
jgi:hypothetical protein